MTTVSAAKKGMFLQDWPKKRTKKKPKIKDPANQNLISCLEEGYKELEKLSPSKLLSSYINQLITYNIHFDNPEYIEKLDKLLDQNITCAICKSICLHILAASLLHPSVRSTFEKELSKYPYDKVNLRELCRTECIEKNMKIRVVQYRNKSGKHQHVHLTSREGDKIIQLCELSLLVLFDILNLADIPTVFCKKE